MRDGIVERLRSRRSDETGIAIRCRLALPEDES
jgi:hypothetical protein